MRVNTNLQARDNSFYRRTYKLGVAKDAREVMRKEMNVMQMVGWARCVVTDTESSATVSRRPTEHIRRASTMAWLCRCRQRRSRSGTVWIVLGGGSGGYVRPECIVVASAES
jgi:hypothetical protein